MKSEVHSLRNFHAAILQLALVVAQEPATRGLLVVADPRIAEPRLRQEMAMAMHALREDVRDRLSLAISRNGHVEHLPDHLPGEFRAWLDELIARESWRPGMRLKRADSFYVVLELLVNRWLGQTGSVTTAWLMKASGCSYPTVAKALGRLSNVVHRRSDRSVELSRFPRDEWTRLLAHADEFRSTMRFADRSGQPRPVEALLERLTRLRPPDVAVGGVFGAQHHQPSLDLVGSPRLDLSLHCPGANADTRFVEKLDPALQLQTHAADRPATLVIHCVRRPQSFFEQTPDGVTWADPVECLLDLHDARLEQQAEAFVRHFVELRRGTERVGT